MNFNTIKKVHLIGIGGIGVSAIARYFVSLGASVSGSDRGDFESEKSLSALGIKVFTSHEASNVPEGAELVVYSSAVPESNPEILLARTKNIPMLEYVEALAEIMHSKYGVGVSGTNGKTTTTAMLGKILEAGLFDPMVIVGGKVGGWDANLRLPDTPKGKSQIFVAEACEYRRHFLKLTPKSVIITIIEAEHLDYFRDLEDVKEAFREFIAPLEEDGFLVYNADDKNINDLLLETKARLVSCSIEGEKADFFATGIHYQDRAQIFSVFWKNESLGNFSIGVPGKFNVLNALEALACALSLGVSVESARNALSEFSGTWRRFERLGKVGETLIISDYAHHPAGVSGTILATKELYTGKKILFIFQPHQKDRTLKLLDEFAEALSLADHLMLVEIYEVAGRNESESPISSLDIVQKIQKLNKNKDVSFSPSLDDIQQKMKNIGSHYDIIVFMGAGDIYKVAEEMIYR